MTSVQCFTFIGRSVFRVLSKTVWVVLERALQFPKSGASWAKLGPSKPAGPWELLVWISAVPPLGGEDRPDGWGLILETAVCGSVPIATVINGWLLDPRRAEERQSSFLQKIGSSL